MQVTNVNIADHNRIRKELLKEKNLSIGKESIRGNERPRGAACHRNPVKSEKANYTDLHAVGQSGAHHVRRAGLVLHTSGHVRKLLCEAAHGLREKKAANNKI